MDLKRVTSALLGFPLVVIVLLLGNKYVIDVVLSVVAIIALQEYYNAFSEYKPIKWIGYLAAVLICFIHLIPNEQIFTYIGLSIPVIIVILFKCNFIDNLFKYLTITIGKIYAITISKNIFIFCIC